MKRTVHEWIGKTPDTAIPARVKLRVIERQNNCCAVCTREVLRRNRAIDHIVALINGGTNRESNLQLLCATPCHANKTGGDVAEKARVYKVRLKEAGLAPKRGRPMPGSKASGLRKLMNGQVVRR